MTSIGVDFLPRDTQKLALTRNLSDGLAAIAGKLFPNNTAKMVEEEWGVDRSTAKNVVKGVAGGVVVTRAVHARQKSHGDAWALWRALGELIIGEPEAAYDARVLQQMSEDIARAKRAAETRSATRSGLEASALQLHGVQGGDRPAQPGRVLGGHGPSPDGMGGQSDPRRSLSAVVDEELFEARRTDARTPFLMRREGE